MGPITGFVVVERDGSLRTEPLVQNKEIGEITGYEKQSVPACRISFSDVFFVQPFQRLSFDFIFLHHVLGW